VQRFMVVGANARATVAPFEGRLFGFGVTMYTVTCPCGHRITSDPVTKNRAEIMAAQHDRNEHGVR
jgi:hypothetical protein